MAEGEEELAMRTSGVAEQSSRTVQSPNKRKSERTRPEEMQLEEAMPKQEPAMQIAGVT